MSQHDLHPQQLARGQAYGTREYMEQVRASKGLRFPWKDVDDMMGPMLPGWFVAVGGRGKAGKTTMLMELLTAWVEIKKKIVYVGTETSVEVLRYVWAAVRCNVPIDTAIDPDCPVTIYDRLMEDVEQKQTEYDLAGRAMFADSPQATVSSLAEWVRYGKEYGADAVIFDHLGQLEVGHGERWVTFGDAVNQIKNLARSANLTIVSGAQLTQGKGGGILGEHEVPGNGSWAGSSEVQRAIDAGIQLWRPFRAGVTEKEKRAAAGDPEKAQQLVQNDGTMGVRLAAHRWGKPANQYCKLSVRNGQISPWTPRTP